MKKRVLIYILFVTTFFSLQSCVSNYVVSNNETYKTDAKLASVNIHPVVTNTPGKTQKVLAAISNTSADIK